MRRLNELPNHVLWTRLKVGGWYGDETSGAFEVPYPATGVKLKVICSAAVKAPSGHFPDEQDAWDHVSVSLPNRCPNWPEMCHVKDLFFHPHETVMQLHVPPEDHVNNHAYCLHLWKPAFAEIPRPPSIMVGVKDAGDFTGRPDAAMALARKIGMKL